MPLARARDGTRLFYEWLRRGGRADDAAVIVLLASWAANGRVWSFELEYAAEAGYSLILPDNRGSGRSDTPRRPWSTATLADDVATILDHAGVARAHVGGASLGGMVAQELALRHPRRVAALVLAATTGGLPRWDYLRLGGLVRLFAGARQSAREGRSGELAVRRVLERAVSPEWAARIAPGDPAWQAIEAMLREPVSRRGNLYSLAAAARHSTWRRLHRISAPTQIQYGSADPLISTRAALALARAIPNAKLVPIVGAGHWLGLERPHEALPAALGFVREHDHLLDAASQTEEVLRE